jgi:glucose/arabinose dehydrogenase
MQFRYTFKIAAVVMVYALLGVGQAQSQTPPNVPIITEPVMDGQIVHPADVHMETLPFSDPDPSDTHLCSDWEIWTIEPEERVWVTSCIGGLEKVHTHLGDGIFENSHAGRQVLLFDIDYRLRVRHRDSSGDPATEWSAWAERLFHTSPATEVQPLLLADVVATSSLQWHDTLGNRILLPVAALPPALRITSSADELILDIRGLDNLANLVTDPPPLAMHGPVHVELDAGDIGQDFSLPASQLVLSDDTGASRMIYLPEVHIPPTQQLHFWVSANGSTYTADRLQTQPDFSDLARSAPLPWTVVQPGFTIEPVATGFQLPVNIAFVSHPGLEPDAPFFYVTELYGTIKVVRRDGTVSDYATNLLNFNPTGKFPGTGEQGLTGIVVDPATGDVYASMLYSRNPADDAAPHYPMVVRFESLDGGRTAATQSVILDLFPESQGQSHQISHLSIGPDNKFYVHMADGLVSKTARDLSAFRGKILRMNLDGSPAADNPFYDASDGLNATDYIYASGFRNPFGGAWSAADTFLYVVENGPHTDRFAQIVPGRDYLWEGNDHDMLNFALYNWSPPVAPVNITFIQPETFHGSGFPAEKMDHAFVSESGSTWASGPILYGKRISEFVVDASGTLVSGPVPLIEYNGAGKATVVALAAGPDGLYFSDFYKDLDYDSPIDRGANILRVVPEVTPLLGYTFVERLTVPVDGSSITSIKPLESGVVYKIRASGTFASSGTDDGLADAEYTGFSDPTQSPQDMCSDATQLVNLGIGINDAVIDQDTAPFWGDFNPTHVYTIDFIGQGAPITLNYHDCNVTDNTGVLKIEIFQPAIDATATFVVQQSGL